MSLLDERRTAEQNEHARFNAACARGGPVLLQTEVGLQLVWRVTPDWWYVCGPNETAAPAIPGRNDGIWAALLEQVSEPRHPLFARRALGRNGRHRR